MIKELLFVVLLCFYSTDAGGNEDLQGYVEVCRAKTGFDRKNYQELAQLIRDPQSRKLFFCVAKSGGLLDASGYLMKELVRRVLPTPVKEAPDVERLLNECVTRKGSPEDAVFNTFICVERRIYYMINGKTLDV
ncbi:uncharacterized protein LOC123671088 [Harmonia axyridis]|uniref:uncharacterized protein LOC123671088 n=1 Tax=Harmonia axyridis TaxID=115357 RepID=UPI001E276407|nr:uncharacterized protein LOC123671088 [Harmonia axyridis]